MKKAKIAQKRVFCDIWHTICTLLLAQDSAYAKGIHTSPIVHFFNIVQTVWQKVTIFLGFFSEPFPKQWVVRW